MKKTSLTKNIFRNIRDSIGRFISIVVIIALGVSFFSGLKVAPEAMKHTADTYYKDYNLMDIRIVSTLGLTKDDLKEIKKINGIKDIKGSKSLDTISNINEKETVVKVHAYSDKNQINGLKLVEGRLPKKPTECVIEQGVEDEMFLRIGEKIKLDSGTDKKLSKDLKNTEYTVVGAVKTPYYLSFEKGNSNIGSGKVDRYIVIPEVNFKQEIFNEIFLTVKGVENLNSYSDEYFDVIEPIVKDIEKIAKEREKIRYNDVIGEAEDLLDEGKIDYEKAKLEVDNKLNSGKDEIEKAKKDLSEGEIRYNIEKSEYDKQISEGETAIAQGKKDLEIGYNEYTKKLNLYEEEKSKSDTELTSIKKEIEDGEEGLNVFKSELENLELMLLNPDLKDEEKLEINQKLEEGLEEYNLKKKNLNLIKEEVKTVEDELIKGKKELDRVKIQLDTSKREIENKENELNQGRLDGQVKLDKALLEINNGKKDLEKAEKEYEKGVIEAEKELKNAWDKIEDGEREIKKIEKAQWYILDRNSHYSYVDYKGAADRIDAIAKVFPVFFALVAALVCLTSMTRMVDEQRGDIGTLKALGYSNFNIAMKYIIYAIIATVIGSTIGFITGYTIFPTVIFNAYSLLYTLPPIILVFNKKLSLIVLIVTILLTTLATGFASINELKENSASLMRPKAPKIGKRILIEKIPFIWNRFNFSQKVTLRNLFRYKRRLLMTVFGIAGCTGLILAGFGIKDSIKTVADTQFTDLFSYDISIVIDSDSDGEESIKLDERIKDYTMVHDETGVSKNDEKDLDINIIVPKKVDDLQDFIKLRDRKDKTKLNIPLRGAIISEQISNILNVDIGDEFIVKNSFDEEVSMTVEGITENYTFNYIYISPEYYRESFMRKPNFNKSLSIMSNKDKDFEEKLSKDLMSKEGILSVVSNNLLLDDLDEVLESLDSIVLVMIISAGALAFVVLYNLNNVNISERIREIATIKVLGFYDNEVSAYIYRENIILTIFGALGGLLIGIYLHRFIMKTVAMDNIMFGLKVNNISYIYSILLTFVFSFLVNLAMHFQLKEVEMVESLKSVE